MASAFTLFLQVVEETVADDDMIMLKGCKSTRAVTVLLRGANDYMLDEMDRSLHDAFCIVKRVLESGTVVPGTPGQLVASPAELLAVSCCVCGTTAVWSDYTVCHLIA